MISLTMISKIWQTGDSYVITVLKQYIDSGTIKVGEKYSFTFKDASVHFIAEVWGRPGTNSVYVVTVPMDYVTQELLDPEKRYLVIIKEVEDESKI